MEKTKILYVDDEKINLMLFKVNFENTYEVFKASDGFSGLEVLEKNNDIDLIISDMKMPKMNGIEFVKKAKSKFPDKHFFILTGFDITDEIKEAIASGIVLKYFSKPMNINEIKAALLEVINN